MKYNIILLLSLFFLTITLIIGSCTIASDENTDNIQKYIGTWNVVDQAAKLNYNVTITYNPSNSSEILLNNFADIGTTAIGLVVGNSIIIDNQQLSSDYSTSGNGYYINSVKLEFNFNLNDGINNEARTALFTK